MPTSASSYYTELKKLNYDEYFQQKLSMLWIYQINDWIGIYSCHARSWLKIERSRARWNITQCVWCVSPKHNIISSILFISEGQSEIMDSGRHNLFVIEVVSRPAPRICMKWALNLIRRCGQAMYLACSKIALSSTSAVANFMILLLIWRRGPLRRGFNTLNYSRPYNALTQKHLHTI